MRIVLFLPRMKQWINTNPGLVVIIVAAVMIFMYMWSWMPAPYSWTYLVKRALFDPSFVCKDGVLSFAKTSNGACSGHGGILRRVPPPNRDYDESMQYDDR